MSFQMEYRILLTICGLVVVGLYGCGQQALIGTSVRPEIAPSLEESAVDATEAKVAESEEAETVTEAAGVKVAYEPWYALGPFYNITFDQVIGPENGPDLSKVYEQDTPFKYKWKQHPEWKDSESLDLRLPANSSMYFYRIANASQATTAEFTVGTGDGIQVWVNGDEVFKRFEVGNANTEKVSANFRKGSNNILLKVYNEDSASELYFEN